MPYTAATLNKEQNLDTVFSTTETSAKPRISLRILTLIPTLKDDPTSTVNSILQQTTPLSKVIVVVGSKRLYRRLCVELAGLAEITYCKPCLSEPLGLRVAKSLNHVLAKARVEDYDYLLRVDADVELPKNFLEENLKLEADVVGKAGYAMLIKSKPFLQIVKGRFPEVPAEDSYINYKFWSLSKKVANWKIAPALLSQSVRKYFWREKFHSGKEAFKLGYEPFHVVARLRRHLLKNVFFLLGYLSAFLQRCQRYEFAGLVFCFQVKRVFSVLS